MSEKTHPAKQPGLTRRRRTTTPGGDELAWTVRTERALGLAVLYLEEGRTAEVRSLALALAWIFDAEGIHREAIAALRLFVQAAQKETATVELAQRLVEYLYRAQYDQELRFEVS